VQAIAAELRSRKVDHVVVTGDLTNLALESEYALAHELFERELGLDPLHVTIVPGNHDVYTRGAYSERRFGQYFASYLQSDLPDLVSELGAFPVVKLRGPLAIIGLSSAVPRLPLVAAGRIGENQLASLRAVLAHPEVRKRTPVVALHHPPHLPGRALKARMEGLHDSDALVEVLDELGSGLVLHGHLHRRLRRSHATRTGRWEAVGATSASLVHPEPNKMAGFNLYTFGADGALSSMTAEVLDTASGTFTEAIIPAQSW
jgi:3',5'-cyclic AMP phosphodiesterase CpdA